MIVENKPNITAEIIVILTEEEARALEALAGYNVSDVTKLLGPSHLRPHEEGLKSLFLNTRNKIARALENVNAARKEMVYKS